MGVAIRVRPVNKGHTLPVNAPSSFKEKLESMFGRLPLRLTMENAYDKVNTALIISENEKEAWNNLLALLEKYGEITVEAEY